MWAYPADKIYFQSCSGGLNFFLWRELTQHENTFQYLFVLKEKQDVKSFQFMCGFSKYQKSPILSLWAFDEYITALNHSVNSCSSVGLRLVYTLAWPADPGQGFTVCETTVLHQGWWPFYPLELHKQVRDWNAFLWRRERREKKMPIIYYSNEMKSSRWWKKGCRLTAENLPLSTSDLSQPTTK